MTRGRIVYILYNCRIRIIYWTDILQLSADYECRVIEVNFPRPTSRRMHMKLETGLTHYFLSSKAMRLQSIRGSWTLEILSDRNTSCRRVSIPLLRVDRVEICTVVCVVSFHVNICIQEILLPAGGYHQATVYLAKGENGFQPTSITRVNVG